MNKPEAEDARQPVVRRALLGLLARFRPAILCMVAGSIATFGMAAAVYVSQVQHHHNRALADVTFAAEQVNQLVSFLDVTAGALSSQISDGVSFSDLVLPRSSLLNDAEALQTVIIVDASGRVVTDFQQPSQRIGRDFSGMEFFVSARNAGGEDLVLGAPVALDPSGPPVYPVSSPVLNREGDLEAIVVMLVDPQTFSTVIGRFIGSTGIEVFLVDQRLGVTLPLLFKDVNGVNSTHDESAANWQRGPEELIVGKTVAGHDQMNLLVKQPLVDLRRAAFKTVSLPVFLSLILTVAVAALVQVFALRNQRLQVADALIADTSKSIPGIIMRYQLAADGQMQALFVSDTTEALLEIKTADVMRDMSRFWSLTHPDDWPEVKASLAEAATGGAPWSEKWRVVTPSGDVKWLQGRGKPKRLRDGTVLWNAVLLEVTELVTAQEELAKSQKDLAFSKRLESVGRLTAGIAHEFNNLMAVVMGNIELALEQDQVNDQEARVMLNDALSALRRGAQQTSDLLQFGRKARLSPEVTTLNTVVNNLQAMLGNLLTEVISIDSNLELNPWFTKLDVSQLESAILNTVLNARDALPEGGTIEIKTENKRVRANQTDGIPEGDYVVLSVSDNGVGMTPDVISKAVDPYFTTKPVGQGTGLGLSAVHGFVKQTSGFLKVDSKVDVGTTIELWFPRDTGAASEAVEGPQQATGETAPAQRETVLLVEDNADVSTTLRRQLSSLGYDVKACPDGQSALDQLRKDQTIRVVLSDIVMPGPIQGDQLARLAAAEGIKVPFVLITGYGDMDSARTSNHMVLSKPTSRNELRDALRQSIDAFYG